MGARGAWPETASLRLVRASSRQRLDRPGTSPSMRSSGTPGRHASNARPARPAVRQFAKRLKGEGRGEGSGGAGGGKDTLEQMGLAPSRIVGLGEGERKWSSIPIYCAPCRPPGRGPPRSGTRLADGGGPERRLCWSRSARSFYGLRPRAPKRARWKRRVTGSLHGGRDQLQSARRRGGRRRQGLWRLSGGGYGSSCPGGFGPEADGRCPFDQRLGGGWDSVRTGEGGCFGKGGPARYGSRCSLGW